MPHTSEKSVIIQTLEYMAFFEEIWPDEELTSDSNSESSTDEEGIDDITSPSFLLPYIAANRYLNSRVSVPKSHHFVDFILPNLDEERFKAEMRVSREAFEIILQEIRHHPIFQSKQLQI